MSNLGISKERDVCIKLLVGEDNKTVICHNRSAINNHIKSIFMRNIKIFVKQCIAMVHQAGAGISCTHAPCLLPCSVCRTFHKIYNKPQPRDSNQIFLSSAPKYHKKNNILGSFSENFLSDAPLCMDRLILHWMLIIL